MIYICTPTSGAPSAHYVTSLLRSVSRLSELQIPHAFGMVIGVSPTQLARNDAVAHFVASDATHLMFIDDDMTFTGDDIVALLAARKPIIGAMCPLRVDGPAYAVMPSATSIVEGECVSVDAVGTGFMLIERSVITSLIDQDTDTPYTRNNSWRWPVFECGIDVHSNTYLSEDYQFCFRAKRKGHSSWVHTGLDIGHVGRHIYRSQHDSDLKRRMLCVS